jgi:hypothetical protein
MAGRKIAENYVPRRVTRMSGRAGSELAISMVSEYSLSGRLFLGLCVYDQIRCHLHEYLAGCFIEQARSLKLKRKQGGMPSPRSCMR